MQCRGLLGLWRRHWRSSRCRSSRRHRMESGPRGPTPRALFNRLDANHDGVITQRRDSGSHARTSETPASRGRHESRRQDHQAGVVCGHPARHPGPQPEGPGQQPDIPARKADLAARIPPVRPARSAMPSPRPGGIFPWALPLDELVLAPMRVPWPASRRSWPAAAKAMPRSMRTARAQWSLTAI